MTSEDACLDALRRAAEKLGESPSKAQYEDLGLTPASGTIIRVCGGWNTAKGRAGLVRSEIDKCEVLCANCHRKEHHTSPPELGGLE